MCGFCLKYDSMQSDTILSKQQSHPAMVLSCQRLTKALRFNYSAIPGVMLAQRMKDINNPMNKEFMQISFSSQLFQKEKENSKSQPYFFY